MQTSSSCRSANNTVEKLSSERESLLKVYIEPQTFRTNKRIRFLAELILPNELVCWLFDSVQCLIHYWRFQMSKMVTPFFFRSDILIGNNDERGSLEIEYENECNKETKKME